MVVVWTHRRANIVAFTHAQSKIKVEAERSLLAGLFDAGIVTPKAIVDSGCNFINLGGRNDVRRIILGNNRRVVGKRITSTSSGEFPEIWFYQILMSLAPFDVLRRIAPECIYANAQSGLLFLEELHPRLSLHQSKWPTTQSHQNSLIRQMAETLFILHNATNVTTSKSSLFSRFYAIDNIPWILGCGATNPSLPSFKSVEEELFWKRLRGDRRVTHFIDMTRRFWHQQCLIHGDIKFSNILAPEARNPIQIIDWELLSLGDPLWDIAGFAASLLLINAAPSRASSEAFKIYLSQIERIISVFHEVYSAYLPKLKLGGKGAFVDVATRYAVVRLIQFGFESIQPGVKRNQYKTFDIHDFALYVAHTTMNEYE